MTTQARFYLLFDDQQSAFDLMAECALCGGITEQPLWQLGSWLSALALSAGPIRWHYFARQP